MPNFVKGVGSTRYGTHNKRSHLLAHDAISEALSDSGMRMHEIDAVVASNLEWFYSSEMQRHFSSMLASTLRTHAPIIRTPAACGGGGTAIWTANRMMKEDEDMNNVLVVGAEKLMEAANNSFWITHEFMMAADAKMEQAEGLNFPTSSALFAQAYLKAFPETTMDDLAQIAFKNHCNAAGNDKAFFYKKPVTLENIKGSPVVCSPLRLFDCSISTDGAAALVLTKDKTDVRLDGSGMTTDYLPPFMREDSTAWLATKESAKIAYEEAGIGPEDIDVAEVHDAFTIVELTSYEELGFCKKGEAYKHIRDGRFLAEGKLPVNISGGLKAKGHPVSATGVGQAYELVRQLRGDSHIKLNNPKTALAHNIGGAGGIVACNIFKKIGG